MDDDPHLLPRLIERLEVRPMGSKEARELAEKEHYMHRRPQVSYAFGLYQDDAVVGVVTFGTPASRHLQMGACPSDPSLVIELNRAWVADHMPPNTGSWFISRTLKLIPPRIVVSYADTVQGHLGYQYRALNFRYAGWTDMERKTPRYDYIPADPTIHTRDAFRNGYKVKVRRRPKVKYWTATGTKTERRQLYDLSGWPSLDWHKLPPPTEHVHHPLTKEKQDAQHR
ncbi:Mom family adenine methylcarbamoylation protein [Streptomyces phaeochromogenes]